MAEADLTTPGSSGSPSSQSPTGDPTRRVISASRSRRELMRQVSDLGMVDPVFDKDLDIQRVLQAQNIFSEDPPSLALEPDNEDASIASDKTADVLAGNGMDLDQFHQSLRATDSHVFVAAPKPLQDDGLGTRHPFVSPTRSSDDHRLKTSSDSKLSKSHSLHSPSGKSSKSSGQRSSKRNSLDLNASMQSLDLEQVLQMSRKSSDGKNAQSKDGKLNSSRSSLNQSRSTTKSKPKDERKSKRKSNNKDKASKKQPLAPIVSSPTTLIKNTPDMDMDQLIREAALAYSPSTPKDNDLLMEALESSHTSLDAVGLLSLDDKQESLRSLVESGRVQQQQQQQPPTHESLPNSLFDSQLRSPTIAIGRSKPTKNHRAMPSMQNIFQEDESSSSGDSKRQLSIPEQRNATIKALVSSSQHKKNSMFSIVDDNADSHKKSTKSPLPERSKLLEMSSGNRGVANGKKKGNKLSSSFNAISRRSNFVESATATASPSAQDESLRSLTSSSTLETTTPGRARRLLNTLNRSAHFGRSDASQSPARQRSSSRSLSRGRRGNDDSKQSPLGDKLKGLLGKLKDDDDVSPRRKGKGIFNKSSDASPGSSRGIFQRPGSPRSSSRPVNQLTSPPQPPVDPEMASPTRSRRTLTGLKASTTSMLEL